MGGPEGAEGEAPVVADDAVLGSEAAVDPPHRVQFADDGAAITVLDPWNSEVVLRTRRQAVAA